MNEQQLKALKIRARYTESPPTDLDELRALDRRVKRAPAVFAYILGSISALVMGAGMSLLMTDIASILSLGDMTLPGLIIGIAGMLMALINYPIYKVLLSHRRKKYSARILELSERIMNG